MKSNTLRHEHLPVDLAGSKPSLVRAGRTDLAFLQEYIAEQQIVIARLLPQIEEIASVADSLYEVVRKGGRIYTFGNGGSACDAMHFAEELVARYLRERPGIRAQHLIDAGTITCWANDYDYEGAFARQVRTLATENDAVVGFTTSGNSPNILRAIEAGNEVGATSIALTGKDGGKVKEIASKTLIVGSAVTSHIQVAHITIVHCLCDLLEQWMYPAAK